MKKIYLQDPIQAGLAELIKRAGFVVWEKESDVEASILAGGVGLLEHLDGIILEITQPGEQANYILAQAILQQKPILCLYQKNKEPRFLLNYLKRPGLPKSLLTKSYIQSNLKNIVDDFLKGLGQPEDKGEKPQIKFTLRITEKIERYLDWKARENKINKADYLRQMIEEEINLDSKYHQEHRQEHR